MKQRIPGKRPPTPELKPSDAQSIDVQFGLEPVIEAGLFPDDGSAPGDMQFQQVECPYCGECFETPVDTSSGSSRYVEDCQICCQPIEFCLEVDHAGALQSLSTLRSD
jgi:Cysteine-rich CPXCG